MNRFTTPYSHQCVLVNQFAGQLPGHSDVIKIRFTGTDVEPIHVNNYVRSQPMVSSILKRFLANAIN